MCFYCIFITCAKCLIACIALRQNEREIVCNNKSDGDRDNWGINEQQGAQKYWNKANKN